MNLIDIQSVIPDVILDIRYATTNNFTGRQLYVDPQARLLPEPLAALSRAADVLRRQGYRLVIFDAYRPPAIQKILQTYCGDTDYVAAVSNHCRAITVDVTIANKDGIYLDMGTEYDDFTPKAHPGTDLITAKQQRNRDILVDALHAEGFVNHPHEWWHFDYEPGVGWPVIDSADELF